MRLREHGTHARGLVLTGRATVAAGGGDVGAVFAAGSAGGGVGVIGSADDTGAGAGPSAMTESIGGLAGVSATLTTGGYARRGAAGALISGTAGAVARGATGAGSRRVCGASLVSPATGWACATSVHTTTDVSAGGSVSAGRMTSRSGRAAVGSTFWTGRSLRTGREPPRRRIPSTVLRPRRSSSAAFHAVAPPGSSRPPGRSPLRCARGAPPTSVRSNRVGAPSNRRARVLRPGREGGFRAQHAALGASAPHAQLEALPLLCGDVRLGTRRGVRRPTHIGHAASSCKSCARLQR